MSQTQPINYAVQAFAGQVRKAPADIVITFQGRKIFSRLLTPQRIGVDYEGEFGEFFRVVIIQPSDR